MDALDEYEAWKKYIENEFEPNVETFRRMKREAQLAQTVLQIAKDDEFSYHEEAALMLEWSEDGSDDLSFPEEWWR